MTKENDIQLVNGQKYDKKKTKEFSPTGPNNIENPQLLHPYILYV